MEVRIKLPCPNRNSHTSRVQHKLKEMLLTASYMTSNGQVIFYPEMETARLLFLFYVKIQQSPNVQEVSSKFIARYHRLALSEKKKEMVRSHLTA